MQIKHAYNGAYEIDRVRWKKKKERKKERKKKFKSKSKKEEKRKKEREKIKFNIFGGWMGAKASLRFGQSKTYKTRRIVISDSFGISKSLQQRIRLQDDILHLKTLKTSLNWL